MATTRWLLKIPPVILAWGLFAISFVLFALGRVIERGDH